MDGRTYGHTDVRTDGNLTPILLGRLPKFGSRPKKGVALMGHNTTGMLCPAAGELLHMRRIKDDADRRQMMADVHDRY